MTSSIVTLSIDSFGSVVDHITKEDKEIKRFTWNNSQSKASVQVTINSTSNAHECITEIIIKILFHVLVNIVWSNYYICEGSFEER